MNERLMAKVFTKKQCDLAKKHGTPAEFSEAVYRAVPGCISMDEARKAVKNYNREWDIAGRSTGD